MMTSWQALECGCLCCHWRPCEAEVSEQVPDQVLQSLQQTTPKVVAALELYAAVVSVEMLTGELRERRAFLFVDSEAARANLISMPSNVRVQSKLLKKLFKLPTKQSMFPWVSRGPSASNIADRPSRFESEFLRSQGFVKLTPDWSFQGAVNKCAHVHVVRGGGPEGAS